MLSPAGRRLRRANVRGSIAIILVTISGLPWHAAGDRVRLGAGWRHLDAGRERHRTGGYEGTRPFSLMFTAVIGAMLCRPRRSGNAEAGAGYRAV